MKNITDLEHSKNILDIARFILFKFLIEQIFNDKNIILSKKIETVENDIIINTHWKLISKLFEIPTSVKSTRHNIVSNIIERICLFFNNNYELDNKILIIKEILSILTENNKYTTLNQKKIILF